ncbi:MAG TPA: hypothetical protein VFQ83_12155 [Candidatus Udaeobacter sp.]|nr:hypothetical protein [Candidatus Udaeobacter sp.]
MNQSWFLRKYEDGSTFGPVRFDQIARWAAAAQIAPHDTLSNDRHTWVKAPMLSQLGMDWLVEITSEHYYGPTTLGALQEFIRLGEIDGETNVINTCNGAHCKIQEMPQLWESERPDTDDGQTEIQLGDPVGPAVSGMSVALQEQIRDLEQSLREERRALMEAEQRYAELRKKYDAALQRVDA